MQIANQYKLDQYEDFGQLGSKAHIHLIRDKRSGKICVRKEMELTQKEIIEFRKQQNCTYYPQVLEVIEVKDKLILIEEYIEGVTLREYMMGEKLQEEQAVKFAVQICQALLPMHCAEPIIVYRDLKPENIMVTSEGIIKLVDFNISRLFYPGKNRDTVLLGTAEYAAPEQFGYFQTDNRTDIYAFGVLFNFMITGKVPVEEISQGKYEPIVRKCIELEPSRRYQKIEEILQELGENVNTKEEETQVAVDSKDKIIRVLKEWTIPGFRTMTWWKIIVAILGYWFILYFFITAEFHNQDGTLCPAAELWLYRIGFGCGVFLCVCYSFNYRGLADKFHVIPYRTRLVHIFESVVLSIGIMFAVGLAIALILTFLGM